MSSTTDTNPELENLDFDVENEVHRDNSIWVIDQQPERFRRASDADGSNSRYHWMTVLVYEMVCKVHGELPVEQVLTHRVRT